jgi:hypothetical protein
VVVYRFLITIGLIYSIYFIYKICGQLQISPSMVCSLISITLFFAFMVEKTLQDKSLSSRNQAAIMLILLSYVFYLAIPFWEKRIYKWAGMEDRFEGLKFRDYLNVVGLVFCFSALVCANHALTLIYDAS